MGEKIRLRRGQAELVLSTEVMHASGLRVGDVVEVRAVPGQVSIRRAIPRYSLDQLVAAMTPENTNIDRDWVGARPKGGEQ